MVQKGHLLAFLRSQEAEGATCPSSQWVGRLEAIASVVDNIVEQDSYPPGLAIKHGLGHVDRLLGNLDVLCYSATTGPGELSLSAEEVFCLLAATWLHDVGLFVHRPSSESPEEAETSYRNHPEQAGQYVLASCQMLHLEPYEADAIAEIIRCHDTSRDFNSLRPPYDRTCPSGERLKISLLGALLRLAGFFELGQHRPVRGFAPSQKTSQRGLIEREWLLNRLVADVTPHIPRDSRCVHVGLRLSTPGDDVLPLAVRCTVIPILQDYLQYRSILEEANISLRLCCKEPLVAPDADLLRVLQSYCQSLRYRVLVVGSDSPLVREATRVLERHSAFKVVHAEAVDGATQEGPWQALAGRLWSSFPDVVLLPYLYGDESRSSVIETVILPACPGFLDQFIEGIRWPFLASLPVCVVSNTPKVSGLRQLKISDELAGLSGAGVTVSRIRETLEGLVASRYGFSREVFFPRWKRATLHELQMLKSDCAKCLAEVVTEHSDERVLVDAVLSTLEDMPCHASTSRLCAAVFREAIGALRMVDDRLREVEVAHALTPLMHAVTREDGFGEARQMLMDSLAEKGDDSRHRVAARVACQWASVVPPQHDTQDLLRLIVGQLDTGRERLIETVLDALLDVVHALPHDLCEQLARRLPLLVGPPHSSSVQTGARSLLLALCAHLTIPTAAVILAQLRDMARDPNIPDAKDLAATVRQLESVLGLP